METLCIAHFVQRKERKQKITSFSIGCFLVFSLHNCGQCTESPWHVNQPLRKMKIVQVIRHLYCTASHLACMLWSLTSCGTCDMLALADLDEFEPA